MAFTEKSKKINISHIEQEFTIGKPIAVPFCIQIEKNNKVIQNDRYYARSPTRTTFKYLCKYSYFS